MEEKNVPYVAYEGALARSERMNKRIFIALIVSIVLLFASNVAWIIYEMQFETISYQQDGEGINNVNSGVQGSLMYGAESKDKN